jgi:quaternary ammonium compound-resistance protein SugE
MGWIALVVSGVLETVWAAALSQSRSFTRLIPSVVFGVALVLSMIGTTVRVSHSVTSMSLRVMAYRQGMATLSYLLSGRRCLSGVGDGLESGAVVVPAGSGLVESSA